MSYYDDQESVANIYVGLAQRGWKCYGYKSDESDSMTDYWSPARWDGIAEKDGYILLVDVYGTSDSGRKITKQGFQADFNKIQKLEALLNDPASTEGEKASCKVQLDKLYNKENESIKVVEEYPTYTQGNPKGCNWHIEKDGEIVAKGKGAYQCTGYLFGGYEEATMKKVNTFIDRIESHLTSGKQLEKVIKKIVKKVIKPIPVTDRKTLQVGDILTFDYHGHYWQVLSIDIRSNGKQTFTYEILGSEKRGFQRLKNGKRYYDYMTKFESNLESGIIKLYELKEVEEVTEKVTYKKTKRTIKNSEQLLETEQEDPTENKTMVNHEDQATKKQRWALYIAAKRTIDTRNINITKQEASELISKSKQGEDITEELKAIVNGESITETANNSEPQKEQEEKATESQETEETTNNNVIDINNKLNNNKVGESENMTIDILNKFDNVTIENDNRISDYDKEVCEKWQDAYNSMVNVLQVNLHSLNELYKKYNEESWGNKEVYSFINKHDDINKLEDRIKEIKNNFINRIIWHFQEQYKVTINSDSIKKKYDESVNYENIVDEIFEQLGGLNFEEKAVNELKEASRNTIHRSDKVKISKNKISITDFIYWDNWSWSGTKISWGENKLRPLFKALSHFERKEVEMIQIMKNIYNEFQEGTQHYNILEKYNMEHLNKVKAFRAFKNGRVDIEFASNELAQKFYNEYLRSSQAA